MTSTETQAQRSAAHRRFAMAQGLRAMADDIEAGRLPEVYDVAPTAFWSFTPGGSLGERLTPEDARRAMAAAPGAWSKEFGGTYITYRKDYGGGVKFDVSIEREAVCRRVQVGTRTEPATEAREIPVWEWVCGPDLPEPDDE